MDSENICRLCLNVCPVLHSVFKGNVHSVIESLTSLTVSHTDNLPSGACGKCIINIYFVNHIRKQIINAQNKLNEIYTRTGNFHEILQNRILSETVKTECRNVVLIKEEKNLFPECDIDFSEEDAAEIPKKVEKAGEKDSDNFEDEINDTTAFIVQKTTTKPFVYYCKLCKVDIVATGQKLNMHRAKHRRKMCKICGISVMKCNFKRHTLKHSAGPQICEICGSVHKSHEGLRTHMYHMHNSNKRIPKCDVCGLTFKYSARLAHHKRKVHTGFRPHQCESCGKQFFDLATLKKHVDLVHLKLRSFICKYCKKGYSSRYALKVHTRQHTDETPYVCEFCSEGFRQSVSLRTHLKSKHGVETKSSTSQENNSIDYWRSGGKDITN